MSFLPVRAHAPSLARALAVAAAAVLAVADPARSQVIPPPGTPPAQVEQQVNALGMRNALRARIGSSGLTPAEIRSRLAGMGYDPRTLDAYLDDTDPAPPPPTGMAVAAVRALGFADVVDQVAQDVRPDPAPPTAEERRVGLRVFGVDVFTRGTSQFEAVTSGALPSSYRLGPGDELVLVITGQVEYLHTLPVTREGYVVIPQVGQVWVNGLTLSDLREQLYSRLATVYSGISRSPGAPTRFDVSVARTRTNQVFITGEVSRPGSYTASPLASVLNVLYQAGGPTANGSFRAVRVLRGGQMVQEVDLYRYLLGGDNLAEVRLEPGDVIFVPVHQRHVAVQGQVNREAIYELKPGETMAQLITFAGGLTAPAHTQRARLERILAPAERREPGVDRVVIDIALDEALANPAAAPELRAGDELHVFALRGDLRSIVSLVGSVWRDGPYAYRPGLRAWDLIELADGLLPEAYLSRAHITRLDRADASLTVIPFSLERGPDGTPLENPALQADDVIRIFSRAVGSEELPVEVTGAVRRPNRDRYQRGMTLRDAIIRAGGLQRTADATVEVARLASPEARAAGQTAQLFKVRVDSTYFVADEAAEYYLGNPAALRAVVGAGEAAAFELEPEDRVLVRTIADFEVPRVVVVRGEVRHPAAYTLQGRSERLRDVLMDRAGGLTPTAFATGFQLKRNGSIVDVDLPAVLKDASHRDNLVLLPGDELTVPELNPVVLVRGAVNSPASVLYRPGADLSYYIASAGGYARHADRNRTHVRYPNGRGDAVSRWGLFFHSTPPVQPGTQVIVPFTPPDERTDMRGLVTDIVQVVGSLATVALVVSRVR